MSDFKKNIILKNIEQTCFACPSQWEGETIDGEYVYIRYRWGHLGIEIDGETIYNDTIGDDLDGVISLEEIESKTPLNFYIKGGV